MTLAAGDVVDLQRIGVRRDVPAPRGWRAALLAAVTHRRPDAARGERRATRAALAFYAAEGFTEIARRRRYYRDGSDAVVMERDDTMSPMTDQPLVLGIETSCDETGVGIVRGHTLLADAVASSVEEHARFGGVVPEVASRAHLEAMVPTIERACSDAGIRCTTSTRSR